MDPRAQIAEAHAVGRAVTVGGIEQVRAQALVQVRRSMGMTREPPAPCLDPDLAYIAPDSVVRRVHGDLPAMLIGGLSALLFQMLHPLAMAGVAQHSQYRTDPLGRLERTATFLGTTTFGTQGAVEYLCHKETLEELLSKLDVKTVDELKPFEALLRVKISRGVPVETTLVAVHPDK